MPYAKNAACLRLLSLVLLLAATGCATTQPPSPPVAVPEPVIPPLSNELKKSPLPTGAYWSDVMQWRSDWQDTLKSLRDKYEGSLPPSKR